MGSRTRIRWTNVARLAAGAIGCAVLVVGLPALLERPQPPPLPEDIGLAHARRPQPTAPARVTRPADRAKHRSRSENPKREPHRPALHQHRSHDRGRAPKPPTPARVAAPAPRPATPAPPAPSLPPAPPPPYVPPAPVAASPPSPPAGSPPGGGSGQSSGPSEFGFER